MNRTYLRFTTPSEREKERKKERKMETGNNNHHHHQHQNQSLESMISALPSASLSPRPTHNGTPRSPHQNDDFLNDGNIPSKGTIITILNKFLSRRPAKEDLIQNRVLKSEYRPIALRYSVIDTLCNHLERNALTQEGIFRVSGSANQIRLFWATFVSDNIDFQSITNEHNVSGALKLYIREQTDPLIPFEQWSSFVTNLMTKNHQVEPADISNLLTKVSSVEYLRIIKRILRMLVVFARHAKINKMNAFNMGVVFGPNLFRSKADSPTIMYESKYSNECVTKLILNYARVFPDLDIPHLGTETNTEDYVDENNTNNNNNNNINATTSNNGASSSLTSTNGNSNSNNNNNENGLMVSDTIGSSPSPVFRPIKISASPSTSSPQLLSITAQLQQGTNEKRIANSPSNSAQQLIKKEQQSTERSPSPIHPSLADANQHAVANKVSPLVHMRRRDFSMTDLIRHRLSKSKHFKKEEGWDHFLVLQIHGNLIAANNSNQGIASTIRPKGKAKKEILNNITFQPVYIFVSARNIIVFDVHSMEMTTILPHDRLKEFAIDAVNPGLFYLQDTLNGKFSYFLVPRPKIMDLLTRVLERGRAIAKLTNKAMAHLTPRKFAMLEQSGGSQSSYGKLPEARPVFEELAARGFSELDVWEGTVDLLEIVRQFKSILVPSDTKAVVEFLLPGIEDFKGVYRKSYKLDINTTVYKIICLICEKVNNESLKPSKFVIRTLKGRTLYDNLSLRAYGLGSLFTTWQLRLISLDQPDSTGNFVVEFLMPDSPEFKGMQKKAIKVDAYQPLKRIMKGLCDKLKVPKYHYYDLIGPEGQVLGGDDILSSIGLGIKFKTCKMKLQKKTFPVGKNVEQDTPMVRSVVNDIMDSVWQKLQERHRERIRIYCKHLLDYIVDQTFIEISKAETVPRRVAMLSRNARSDFYSLLATKEEDDLILSETDGYKNLLINARSVVENDLEPSPNYPIRRLGIGLPSLRDIKLSNARNTFMSDLVDQRQRIHVPQLKQQVTNKFKARNVNSNSLIVSQLALKPGTSKLVEQLKTRMADVKTYENIDEIEDLVPTSKQ
ncbi:RhoGAP domain-containing protein [Heterostelium album PN500]|uniref:RhoGAP domain-containing protein n=1 Tax=Heterostelium pallidum (strain ATCC 26659 / Pp 5 / PN500) TaxID=670386 RepID=D3BSL7_HETP5|nr:RhoGAP domain-containing protein [Heterostelium album PN500]EFA75482.1 RhoGAP domain-containing protein [Heterostelium album PN500]|eukprot:XP_020427616.1 RhoGAP domain-containing protein [Heterostelium album PN500]